MMQDRFKFRVWNNTNKSFIKDFEYPIGSDYQLVLSQDGLLYELGLGDYDDFGETNSWGTLKPFSDVVIQQCTGLKDKNGTLIYEGDVLGGIYEGLYVAYCENCRQFQLKANDYGCMACSGDIHWAELVEDNNKIEVIGNIYMNKELLNG